MKGSVNIVMSTLNEKRRVSGVMNTQKMVDTAGQSATPCFSKLPERSREVYTKVTTYTLSPETHAEELVLLITI